MRFEMAKNQPFNTKRRLNTWKQKEKTFAPKKEKAIMLTDKMKNDYDI